jgi:hypothetical protein
VENTNVMSAWRANSVSADAAACAWMSKWRKALSANAGAPNIVKARQRMNTVNRRCMSSPDRSLRAVYGYRRVTGLNEKTVVEEKTAMR